MSNYVVPVTLGFVVIVVMAFLWLSVPEWLKQWKEKAAEKQFQIELKTKSDEELFVIFRDPSAYSAADRKLAEKILKGRNFDLDEPIFDFRPPKETR